MVQLGRKLSIGKRMKRPLASSSSPSGGSGASGARAAAAVQDNAEPVGGTIIAAKDSRTEAGKADGSVPLQDDGSSSSSEEEYSHIVDIDESVPPPSRSNSAASFRSTGVESLDESLPPMSRVNSAASIVASINGSINGSLTDRYDVSQMRIPPFRGQGQNERGGSHLSNHGRVASMNSFFRDNNRSSWRAQMSGRDLDADDDSDSSDDLYYENQDPGDDDDGSTTSSRTSSSVGIHSSFIRGQIEKQKSAGNWNSSIASVPSSVGGGSPRRDSPKRAAATTAASNEEEGAELREDKDRNIESIEELNQEDDSGPPEKRVMDESEQIASRDIEKDGEEAQDSSLDTDGNNNNNNMEGGMDSPPKLVRAVTVGPSNLSSRSEKPSDPLSKSERSSRADRQDRPSHVKRVLSSTSLIDMMRIQPICEQNELKEDMEEYNLEETIQIDAATSVDDMTNVSEFTVDDDKSTGLDVSDKSGGVDGMDIASPKSDGQDHDMEDSGHDTADATGIRGNETMDEETIESETGDVVKMASVPSFLPSFVPDSLQQKRRPLSSESSRVDIENAPDMDKPNGFKRGESDSDTFYLQSVASEENITHVSDAPDYDYYSISTEDDSSLDHDRDRHPKRVVRGGIEAAMQRQQKETDSEASEPVENEKQVKPAAQKVESEAQKLSEDVCGLLGLPKGNIRKVHGRIMSRDTELQLRRMAGKEERVARSDALDGRASPKADLRKINAGTSEETDDGVSSSDEGSDSSSECLEFGPSSKEKRVDKWEKIRLQRKSSRELRRSQKQLVNNNQCLADSSAENPRRTNDAPASSLRSGERNEVMQNSNERSGSRVSFTTTDKEEERPPRRVQTRQPYQRKNSDDSGSVSSSTSAMVGELKTRLGSVYRSITSRPGNDGEDESYDDSSEGEEEEDEGPVWDKNVLTEGEYYVAMSMLVYVYSLLRETSLLGHTDVGFDEIDVNSFQSDAGYGGGGGGSGNDFLSKTRSAGFIIRVVMDELEKKGAFSSVERNEGDMSVLKEFKKWVHDSRSKQLDAATEATIKELRRKVARRRWKRAINAVRLMVRLGHSDSNNFAMRLAQRKTKQQPRTLGGMRNSLTGSIEELTKALQKAPRMPRALSGSMLWMHDQRSQILSSLGMTPPSQESLRQQSALVGESEIKDIINDALEEPRFFIEGSLLSNLIESGIEVVWFGDRHPNDVVYSICVNRQYKRVSVVFRGTVNAHNWQMNMKFGLTEHPNPIADDYPGREDMLGLHTGFSLYMTRQRKDDSLTKIEEIFSNIDSIGREMAPDGSYELSITGHSLGGALATILSFYAATTGRFSRVKTIRVFTYAAPRVGCQKFLRAYQYLERIGKLRHARFSNTCDLVPLIPVHGLSGAYKHVGMNVRLLGTNKYAQYWLRQALDVTYPKHQGVLSQIWRGLRCSFIRNMNTPQGYKRNHTLSEYQRRIRFALEYRSMLAQAGYFHSRKRSRLKTLDEYYFIKGASNVTVTGELTRISLEDRAKERVRREARKIVIFLLVVVMLQAVVLVGVLKQSVPCENYPIFLYPLFLLTGCRKGETRKCSLVNEMADEHFSPQVESIPSDSMKLNSTNELPETTPLAQDRSSEKEESWIFSWMDWMWTWKTPKSNPVRRPCVWGRCDFLLRPYMLWGVGLRHEALPSMIASGSFEPFHEENLQFNVAVAE